MKDTRRGFTLIELMIVLVIVSILAAVAVPSYRNYVRRSDRADAKVALMQNAQFLERNFTLSNRYDQDGGGAPVDSSSLPVQQSPTNAVAKYDLTVDFPTPTTYTLTAAPVAGGAMDGDVCGSFTLNQAGMKAVTGSETVATCWNK